MAIAPIDIEKMTTLGLLPENLPAAYTTKNIWAPYTIYSDTYTITKPSVGEHAIYNAIRHIIRTIDESHLWSLNWDLLEHFLAQCAVQFPHSFDYVARVIAWRYRTKKSIDKALWTDIARMTAAQNAEVGRDSEVVWALWLIKELGSKIQKSTTDLIVANNGAVVLAFLAHCAKHKVASDKNMRDKLCSVVEGNPFAGTYWPLTLELNHLGMADPAWLAMKSPPSLRALHDANASSGARLRRYLDRRKRTLMVTCPTMQSRTSGLTMRVRVKKATTMMRMIWQI